MKLQGECTLTQEEKATEAARLVKGLIGKIGEMNDEESIFVTKLDVAFRRFGTATAISTRQLFWLRDLNLKY